MAIATTQPTIYISYSHKDKKWLDRVFKHLQVLQTPGREFRIWADTDIKAGDRWHEAIRETLEQAALAILLVSPDSLASKFINEIEVSRLLERNEAERLPIIPIIVRPCNWQQVHWLSQFQVVPANGKALSELSTKNVDKELTRLTEVIARQLEQAATSPGRPRGKDEVQVSPLSEEVSDRAPKRENERADAAGEATSERAPTTATEQTSQSITSDAAPPPSSAPGTSTQPELISYAQLDIKFSVSADTLIQRAVSLAEKARPHPSPITTGYLLFALEETNHNSDVEPGAGLFFSEMYALRSSDSWQRVRVDYDTHNDNPATRTDISKLLTPYAADTLRLAREISTKITTQDQPEPDALVHSRHLLAALLLFTPTGVASGAHAIFSKLGYDLAALRAQYLTFLREHYPQDDLTSWQALLLPSTTTSGGEQADDPVAPQPAEQAPPTGGDDVESPLEADPRRRMPGFSPDTYTETDLLDIEGDVKAFATLIAARAVTPPLSIGLFGDWGSGKTFFMRHLRREVEQVARDARDSKQPQSEIAFYKHIVQIEFNAWHYGEGNLWAGLVEHIFRNLRLNENDSQAEIVKRQEHMLDQLALEKAAEAKASAAVQQAQEKLDTKNEELTDIKQQHAAEAARLGQLSQANVIGALLQSIALAPDTKAQINQALEQAGLPQVQQGATDLQDALMAAQSAAKRGRSVLTTLTEAKDRGQRLLLLVIILFAAPAIGLLVAYLINGPGRQGLAQIAAVAGTLATLLTTGAAWIQKQLAWAADWIKKAEHATHEIDKQVALKQAENNKQMEMHTQQLDLLKAEYLALRREREEAQRRVEQIQTEITQQSAVFRLGRFIQDRAQSDDYRKHLGVLALIRRDFEELSRLMSEDNERLAKLVNLDDEKTDAPVRVNRIVLYIDDLDRCPPQQVVAVLQAVHLLLAFQLFVVVVGVDGRWVARALSKQYPELLGGGDSKETTPDKQHDPDAELRATPHDYLEKIFQIPFWLKPLEAKHTKRMLQGLLEKSITQASGQNGAGQSESPAEPTQTVAGSPSLIAPPAQAHVSVAPALHNAAQTVAVTQEDHADRAPGPAGTTLAGASMPAGGAGDNSGGAVAVEAGTVTTDSGQHESGQHSPGPAAAQTQKPPQTDLNPAGLEISAEELQFMEELTPLLGRSPRAVKRFVNVYRLIKSGLAPDERPRFLRERVPASHSRIVMFLLSIATGLPGISREFFEQLQDLHEAHLRAPQQAQAAPDPPPQPPCLEALMKSLYTTPELHPELTTLQAWLDDKAHEAWPQFQLDPLLAWSKRVARFSFRVKGL